MTRGSDRDALFVQLADEAVYIGPSPTNESYLRGDKILAAAKQTQADGNLSHVVLPVYLDSLRLRVRVVYVCVTRSKAIHPGTFSR